MVEIDKLHQETRDSVSTNPNILPILIPLFDKLKLYPGPFAVYERSINNSFIAGHSVNGIVGPAVGIGGGQVVVGPTDNSSSLLRVVPSNGVWVNFLRDTFENKTSPNIGLLVEVGGFAKVDVVNHSFTLNGSDWLTWLVSKDAGVKSRVTVFLDDSSARTNIDFSSDVDLLVSGDNGSSWDVVSNKVTKTLSVPGSEVLFKIRGLSSGLYWQSEDSDGVSVPIIVVVQ